jgi:hypothetical protein
MIRGHGASRGRQCSVLGRRLTPATRGIICPDRVPNVYTQHEARSRFFHGDRGFGRNGRPPIPAHDWNNNPVGSTRGWSCVGRPRQDPVEHGPATGPWALNSIIPVASDLSGRPGLGPLCMSVSRHAALPRQHRAGSWTPRPQLGWEVLLCHVIPQPTPKRKSDPSGLAHLVSCGAPQGARSETPGSRDFESGCQTREGG